MYGYCGNTQVNTYALPLAVTDQVYRTAHCGDGCQSGPCLGPPKVAPPGPKPAPANANPGKFDIIGQAGVPPMHMGLMLNGKVVFLDKVENYTQLKLPNGQYAYSSEYDPVTNRAVPLSYSTNAFCSGGSFLADGRLVSVGGNAPLSFIDATVGDGFTAIRYLTRSATDASLDGQNWSEPGNKMSSARWYATAQIMPDGTIFVASGSLNGLDPSVAANNNPTYEILNRNGVSRGIAVPMDLLVNNQPYFMYPFVHLLNDGTLFVFVSKSSQIFSPGSNAILKALPDLIGDYRTYPNTGTSVMLPLSSANGYAPDILVCGGGPYQDISAPTDASCGRIQPLSANAAWEMDAMPEGRCMVEGNLLLDGTVLFLNGVNQGAQGFGVATNPTLEALIYDAAAPLGQRWTTGASSTIGRLYHSVSTLLLDGTVLVAGSNPVEQPVLQPSPSIPYVTEFRVERYTPPYLWGAKAGQRPTNMVLSTTAIAVGTTPPLRISFGMPSSAAAASSVKIVLYHGGFVTHSLHMGHRMVYLDYTGLVAGAGAANQTLTVSPPPNANVAPPGPYAVFVVVDGVPGIGQMVLVS
jgi:Glyoxal oxidase N-terminus/Domain of unknown function (DUF1929)